MSTFFRGITETKKPFRVYSRNFFGTKFRCQPYLQEEMADEINNLLARYLFTVSHPLAAKNDQFSEGDLRIFAQPEISDSRLPILRSPEAFTG
jgi:hypothetical protein